MTRRNKSEERDIARERVAVLVEQADAAVKRGQLDRAHRYADLAWRVKTKYQLRGVASDGRVCRACHGFLAPGSTARVRLREGRRSTTCLRCGSVRRVVLRRAPPADAP